jgi:methionyl-tRNA formyltransferase
MKVIFMGGSIFAVPALRALVGTDADIVAVYTKQPKPAGRRGLGMTQTAVHLAAQELGLRVETPATLRDPETQRALHDLQADIAVVAAYGLLLPAQALVAPRLGCFNLHASLLPRWRGAAPIQRAIMAGDSETGVSIMRMEVGLDTGPIAAELRTPVLSTDTAGDLTARLSDLAAHTLGENWDALISERLPFAPQSANGVTYARKIEKAETAIDWFVAAIQVRGHIHGLSPFPGATTEIRTDKASERLKILRAEIVPHNGRPGEVLDLSMTIACGEGAIRALQVQRAGRNAISGVEFMRSGVLRVGETLAGKDPLSTN